MERKLSFVADGSRDISLTGGAFPLLADPSGYRACRWDLSADADKRAYWLHLFRSHFESLLEMAVAESVNRGMAESEALGRVETGKEIFHAYLDEVRHDPYRYGPLDILTICRRRESVLRQVGFDDPYRLAKCEANKKSIELLPSLLAELDRMSDADRNYALIEGVFAGNIFDLGAVETVAMYASGDLDFHATRKRLRPRPWFVDDLDRWFEARSRQAYRSVVIFVDNSGPDIVLGMIPFARELLQRGSLTVLTANTRPSLNDITHDELVALMDEVAVIDPVIGRGLCEKRLVIIPSGNDAPLIDLSRVSVELSSQAACEPVDLVVLEGMGRAIESNYDARMTCDVIKIAMIKDQGVADAMGASVFDLVFRYESSR